MNATFRWFGEGNDTVSLRQIRQIPGVEGIVWSLHHAAAGDEWSDEDILHSKNMIESYGFHIHVVESLNIHEDIKLGNERRDQFIENYIRSMVKLAKAGVKVICYNFMPVFDWIRTDFFAPLGDGSTAMFFERAKIEGITPVELVNQFSAGQSKFTLPGWESERLKDLESVLEQYENVDEDKLFDNLQYFLQRIIPVCEKYDIKMAIHPDDPPFNIFGLPRIVYSQKNIKRLLDLNNSIYHGLTLCTGSLSANQDNQIEQIIKDCKDRIHFAHIRNIKRFENGDFIEVAHKADDGSVDVAGIVKTLYDTGFSGYVRPDHGRHIWDERCRPGYGLYDRALGLMYILGIWDGLKAGRCDIDDSDQ